jgi:aminoglycoside phosphotransferase (APT) family kinase protein
MDIETPDITKIAKYFLKASKIDKVKYLNNGYCALTFLVNNKIVFKIPKNEKFFDTIKREEAVLRLLNTCRGKASPINMPQLLYSGNFEKHIPVVGMTFISGVNLSIDEFNNLPEMIKKNAFCDIGELIKYFHSLTNLLDEQKFNKRIFEVDNHLNFWQMQWQDNTKSAFSPEEQKLIDDVHKQYIQAAGNSEIKLAFSHGDLHLDNLLFCTDKQIFKGVIDFAGAVVADEVYDLRNFVLNDVQSIAQHAGILLDDLAKIRMIFHALSGYLEPIAGGYPQYKDINYIEAVKHSLKYYETQNLKVR